MATNHNFHPSIPNIFSRQQRLLISIKGNAHLLIHIQLTLGLKPSLEHTRGRLTYTCQNREAKVEMAIARANLQDSPW